MWWVYIYQEKCSSLAPPTMCQFSPPKKFVKEMPSLKYLSLPVFFSIFLLIPLGKYKKSRLKELKFVRFQKILNPAFCWKFQLPTSKTVGCPHFWGVNISNLTSPLYPKSCCKTIKFWTWKKLKIAKNAHTTSVHWVIY